MLLGSASMSLIDPASTNRCRAKEKGCRIDGSDGQETLAGHSSVDGESVGLTGRRALGGKHSPRSDRAVSERPVAPEVDPTDGGGGGLFPNARAEVPFSDAQNNGRRGLLPVVKTGTRAARGGRGGGRGSGGRAGDASHASRSSEALPPRNFSGDMGQNREDRQAGSLSTDGGAGKELIRPTLHDEGKSNNATSAQDEAREEEDAGGNGGGARTRPENPPGRESGESAKPEGRRNNSRGACEDGGGDGGGGGGRLTEGFRRPDEEGGCKSEDMELPAHTEVLPDWVDTIKVGALKWLLFKINRSKRKRRRTFFDQYFLAALFVCLQLVLFDFHEENRRANKGNRVVCFGDYQ